ncbi:MAG: hypothetical protein JZU65_22285 [Chlorobium sp.]|nr:hypothetical protein [Chlorobium sp.]
MAPAAMAGNVVTGINPQLLYNKNSEKVWLSRMALSARARACAAVGGMGVGACERLPGFFSG